MPGKNEPTIVVPLDVEAEASWEIQEDIGEVLSPYIIARIKDPSGNPVTGLTFLNFKVVMVGWDDSPVDLEVTLGPFEDLAGKFGIILPGTYKLRLRPPLPALGRFGQFIFALFVTFVGPNRISRIRAEGQALVSVVKLK